MSNYTQNVNFTAKDSLITGDASKKIKGVEMDAELSEISTAIATKEDTANKGAASGYASLGGDSLVPQAQLPVASETVSGRVELATNAETVTGTDTVRAVTPAGVEAWAAQNAGYIKDLSDMTDPGADRILFWDFSAGAVVHMTVGSNLTITGTTLSANAQSTTDASLLTSGILPDARIQASGVTQHQASLTILETQITDGALLARLAANETVAGTWVFTNMTVNGTIAGALTLSGAITVSGTFNKSGGGRYPYFGSATQSSGIITIGTAAVSGTPAAGDIYIQHEA